MLPFTKRTARPEEAGDVIQTGEFEVVRAGNAAKVKTPFKKTVTPAGLPRLAHDSVSDDEKTMVFSGKTKSSPPALGALGKAGPAVLPRVSAPPPPPGGNTMALPRSRPRPPVSLADEQTQLRPGDRPAAKNAMMQAKVPMPAFPSAAKSAPPLPSKPAGALPNGPDSGRLDVPATVITTRTNVMAGRPTFSWAAALMAMGVFVGLASAVVARGDTDALIDATASLVDPSHARTAAAAPAPEMMVVPAAPVAVSAASPAAACAPSAEPVKAETVVTVTEPATKSVESLPKVGEPAKVAAAPAPAPAPVRRPAYVAPRPQPAAVAVARPAPKPAAERPAPAAKRESESDASSAADALARAQLEASLH